ncbi:MAG: response regulator transcription factor [Tannerella sp.]|nr:response regulator transcription factor [Tannerella sp.]
MKTIRLLLIEDDEGLLKALVEGFEFLDGYEIRTATDGEAGYAAFLSFKPDMIVSDIGMPGMSGIELARKIRETDAKTPIILLTGYTGNRSKKESYGAGIDEFLAKPVSPAELDLRIRAILRRTVPERKEDSFYTIGLYTFDYEQFNLIYGNKKIKLTGMETRILRLLCKNAGNLVKREYILKEIWGDDDPSKSNNLDVYITKLRNRLSKDPTIEITVVRGEGLQLSICPKNP